MSKRSRIWKKYVWVWIFWSNITLRWAVTSLPSLPPHITHPIGNGDDNVGSPPPAPPCILLSTSSLTYLTRPEIEPGIIRWVRRKWSKTHQKTIQSSSNQTHETPVQWDRWERNCKWGEHIFRRITNTKWGIACCWTFVEKHLGWCTKIASHLLRTFRSDSLKHNTLFLQWPYFILLITITTNIFIFILFLLTINEMNMMKMIK